MEIKEIILLHKEISFWSKIYELSFQFWPKENNVFIAKDGVDLYIMGGYESIEEIYQVTVDYLRRINPKMYRKFLDSITFNNCEHKNIIGSNGCFKCADCGASDY